MVASGDPLVARPVRRSALRDDVVHAADGAPRSPPTVIGRAVTKGSARAGEPGHDDQDRRSLRAYRATGPIATDCRCVTKRPEVAAHYKHGAHEALSGLAAFFRDVLPELDDRQAAEAASMTIVLVGSLWTHTHPAAAVRAAYEADPDLAFLPTFTVALDRALTIFLVGLLSDPDR
ncbi:hypothetical protein [Streptomyces sp. DT195]|uniref:hypothetical protein n=1 Tax=Streptomyces sp. DT195 TaxID=3393419 RepID=UPI003CE992B5